MSDILGLPHILADILEYSTSNTVNALICVNKICYLNIKSILSSKADNRVHIFVNSNFVSGVIPSFVIHNAYLCAKDYCHLIPNVTFKADKSDETSMNTIKIDIAPHDLYIKYVNSNVQWGLFANRTIKAGSLVAAYVGELINSKEAAKRLLLYDSQVILTKAWERSKHNTY